MPPTPCCLRVLCRVLSARVPIVLGDLIGLVGREKHSRLKEQCEQKYSREPVSTGDSWNLQVWDQLKDPLPKGQRLQIFSLHQGRSRNVGEEAQRLTFIECFLYTSHCADSFTYVVFWARYCSHVTDDRLWEA